MDKFRRFATLLKIQPGEELLIGYLVLLAALLELAFTFIESMAFGLFLVEYGPQSLPYSYIVIAILAPVAAVLYIKLGERISFSKTLLINLSFSGISSFLAWLGLKSLFFHSVSFILPLLYQVVTNLGTRWSGNSQEEFTTFNNPSVYFLCSFQEPGSPASLVGYLSSH